MRGNQQPVIARGGRNAEDVARPEVARTSGEGPAVIEVGDLEVSYHVYGAEPVRALRNVSFRIAPGEILGLVGESGSGKTTLARAIMRVIPLPGRIERGEIFFMGKDLGALSDVELGKRRGRDLAMIVANPRGELNPLLRIGQQIATVAEVHLGVSRKRGLEMALEMLRAVAIPDPEQRLRAYPHELSGGMAQRVVIAMALICGPRFVISDDATSGLDVTVQAQVLDLLRKLVREQKTSMLYITRDIGVAANFCDRVGIIYKGEIVENAPTEAFFSGPAHPYGNLLFAAFSHDQELRRRWMGTAKPADGAAAKEPCLYAERCFKRQARCFAEHPTLRKIAGDRLVRCHFPIER
ncbi:MAG: ABC transporter ATP-binding protein [Acetobacteraceae bacterium]